MDPAVCADRRNVWWEQSLRAKGPGRQGESSAPAYWAIVLRLLCGCSPGRPDSHPVHCTGQAREIGGMREGNSSLVLVVGIQSENVGTERARCNVVETRTGGRGFVDDNDSWPRSIPEALERTYLTTPS